MASTKQKPKTIEVDGVEYPVNDDGLPLGVPVDFATLQRILTEHRNDQNKHAQESEAAS